MRKFLPVILSFTLLVSMIAAPISTSASAKTDLGVATDENRNYTEYIVVEDNHEVGTFSMANTSNGENTAEIDAIIENAVVENNAVERNVTTVDESGNEVTVHYDKVRDELTITSDAYTDEELKQAEEAALELAEVLEVNIGKDQAIGISPMGIQDGPWTSSGTSNGSTGALKTTLTLTGIAIAGFMGLTGIPGALTAVAVWVFDNKAPTVYYTTLNYYKHDPLFTTKKTWQWYKNSARTQKVGSAYSTYREYYD